MLPLYTRTAQLDFCTPHHLGHDGGNEIPLSSNDPAHLFEIGSRCYKDGTIGVLAGQLGLISHYARDYPDVPYLVKLNSKSHLIKTSQRDPISQALWDMDDVMSLVHNGINVVGIGYTIYVGSEYEHEMMSEAAQFIRQAHELGMISVVWMYPRGKAVADEKDPQLISGAAGVAACIVIAPNPLIEPLPAGLLLILPEKVALVPTMLLAKVVTPAILTLSKFV